MGIDRCHDRNLRGGCSPEIRPEVCQIVTTGTQRGIDIHSGPITKGGFEKPKGSADAPIPDGFRSLLLRPATVLL